jgi:hypothetical protein
MEDDVKDGTSCALEDELEDWRASLLAAGVSHLAVDDINALPTDHEESEEEEDEVVIAAPTVETVAPEEIVYDEFADKIKEAFREFFGHRQKMSSLLREQSVLLFLFFFHIIFLFFLHIFFSFSISLSLSLIALLLTGIIRSNHSRRARPQLRQIKILSLCLSSCFDDMENDIISSRFSSFLLTSC